MTKIAEGSTTIALRSVGFLGAFQVDYRANRFRANGRIAGYYWLLKRKAQDGVCLDDLDPAYHPFDLETIKRLRHNLFGRPGRHTNTFRVRDPFSSGFCQINCSFHLHTDTFGQPLSVQGVMFDVPAPHREEPANPYSDLMEVAGHLKEARRLAERNSMEHLGRDIGRVFDQAGTIAVNRVLE